MGRFFIYEISIRTNYPFVKGARSEGLLWRGLMLNIFANRVPNLKRLLYSARNDASKPNTNLY